MHPPGSRRIHSETPFRRPRPIFSLGKTSTQREPRSTGRRIPSVGKTRRFSPLLDPRGSGTLPARLRRVWGRGADTDPSGIEASAVASIAHCTEGRSVGRARAGESKAPVERPASRMVPTPGRRTRRTDLPCSPCALGATGGQVSSPRSKSHGNGTRRIGCSTAHGESESQVDKRKKRGELRRQFDRSPRRP